MVNDKESDTYEEPKERNPRVMCKLKVCNDPASKNIPHEEEFDDDNYKAIEQTPVSRPPILACKIFYVLYLEKFWIVILL